MLSLPSHMRDIGLSCPIIGKGVDTRHLLLTIFNPMGLWEGHPPRRIHIMNDGQRATGPTLVLFVFSVWTKYIAFFLGDLGTLFR